MQYGLRPLHRAAAYLMLSTVRVLLTAGADPRLPDNRKRLPSAMLKKRCCIVNKAGPGSGQHRGVQAAIRRENSRLIEKLLSDGIDASALSAIQSQLDVVQLNPISAQIDLDALKLG